MTKVLAVLLAVALGLAGWQYVRAQSVSSERDERAADLAIERANALGLSVQVADERTKFIDLARETDSLRTGLDSLLTELDGLRARNATLVGLVGQGSGSGTADTVYVTVSDSTGLPQTIEASFDGPPFWSTINCTLFPEVSCNRDWRAEIAGRVLMTELADGRVIATAESDTEGIEFNITSAAWVPPEPPPFLLRLWRSPIGKTGLGLGLAGLVCWRVC